MKSFWNSPLFDALRRPQSRVRRRRTATALECLEDRCLLAQVAAVWVGGTGNWNDPNNWDIHTVPNNNGGTTYAVSIDGGAAANSAVTLNISVAIDSLTVTSGDSLTINDAQRLDIVNSGAGTGTITNAGNILLNSAGNGTDLRFVGNGTLTGSGTLTMGNNFNNRIYGDVADTVLTNESTIQGSGQLGFNFMKIVNQGTILANQTTVLNIDPNDVADGVVNTGVMRASGGGTLQLAFGNYTNTNGTIAADAASAVQLSGPSITGGTLDTTGTGEIRSLNGAVLKNLTNAGTYHIPDATNTLLVGTITNTGNFSLTSAGNGTDLRISGDVTLTGGGTVTMGNNTNNRIFGNLGVNRLINVDNTIQGAGQIGANQMLLTNQGTIIANASSSLIIDPTDGADGVTNAGTLSAVGGNELRLGFGSFTNAGVIDSADGSTVTITAAEVIGGTLQTEGSGIVRSGGSATLNGVTNTGAFVIPDATATVLVGTITNTGTIALNSTGNGTDIHISGDVTLQGGGSINMGNNTNNRIFGNFGTNRLTNVDNTIQGAGQIGLNQMLLTNQGTIISNLSSSMVIDPTDGADGVINQGTLLATNGTELLVRFGSFTNPGTIQANDSSVVTITFAEIIGGTLQTVGTGIIRSGGGATLNGVTNTGAFVIPDATSATLVGTMTNSGTIALNSQGNGTDLRINGDVTLQGGGTINMGNNFNNRIFGSANTDKLTNVDNTIRGSGQIGGNFMRLLNQGTIIADQSNVLQIDPTDTADGVINEGEMRSAAAGSNLTLNGGTFTNTLGTIKALDNAFVDLNSASIIGGILDTEGSGQIRGNSAAIDSVTNDGRFVVRDAASTTLKGTITNHGTIEMNSAGNGTDLRINGTVTLQGGGLVAMGNNINNRILAFLAPGVDHLINVDNTIQGSGQLGGDTLLINNQGTIRANQSNPLIVDPTDAANGVVNQGFMQAANGANLVLQFGNFVNTSGTIQATDTSVVTVKNATVIGGTLETSGTGSFNTSGSARLNGVTNTGTFVVVDATTLVLQGTITNSGDIRMNSAGNGTDLRINGDVSLTGGGTVTLNGNVNNRVYGDQNGNETLTNVDNIIRGGGQLGLNGLHINNQGTIAATIGTLFLDPSDVAGSFTSSGTLEIDPGATLQMAGANQLVQTAGTTIVNGTLNSNQTVDIQGGTLNGSGTVNANVTNAGQLGAGTAAGNLSVNGNYTQAGTGGFNFQIGGTTAGTQYDQLTVSGGITLTGPLNITLVNGFTPSVNDTFTIVNKTSPGDVTGQFDNLDEGDSFTIDGDTYRINYKSGDGNDVVLTVTAVKTDDFGDAPDTYGTTLANNGARHVGIGPRLGTNRDLDADGQPGATATGDDTHGVDDEDGVNLPASITQGQNAAVSVAASGVGMLDAWVDFNRDGDFNDPGEQIFQNQAVSAAGNELSFAVPIGASIGQTYARFRISSAGNLGPTGEAADGEVEDYALSIAQFVPTLSLEVGGGAVTWVKKQPPVKVLPQATVTGDNFGGGTLVISTNVVATKKKSLDNFSFPSASAIGTAGQATSNGILTVTIQLSENATAEAIQSYLRGITFSTKGKGLKTLTRTLHATLTDDAANHVSITQTINVKKKA